jgi:SHS2 domain-containing protein
MWAYMTDLRTVEVDAACTRVVEARGVDLISLLFAWLDGCLCCYGQDYFVGREVAVTHWGREGAGGGGSWCIRAVVRGEKFVFGKHEQGTEVKAITYSNMQIFAEDGTVYSANDAGDAAAAAAAAAEAGGSGAGEAVEGSGGGGGGGGGGGDGGGGGGSAAAAAAADAAPSGAAVRGARRGPVDVYCIIDI